MQHQQQEPENLLILQDFISILEKTYMQRWTAVPGLSKVREKPFTNID